MYFMWILQLVLWQSIFLQIFQLLLGQCIIFWRIFQIFLEQCIYYFYADNPIIFATVYLYEDSLVIFGTVYIFYSTYSVVHLYFWCGGVQDKREEEKNINNPGPGKFIKLRGSKSGLRGGGEENWKLMKVSGKALGGWVVVLRTPSAKYWQTCIAKIANICTRTR